MGDLGAEQEEAEPLSHTDTLERVLQLLPMLRSSSELTNSLYAAISKVSPMEGKLIQCTPRFSVNYLEILIKKIKNMKLVTF